MADLCCHCRSHLLLHPGGNCHFCQTYAVALFAVNFCFSAAVYASTSQGHTPGGTVSAMWVSFPTLVYRAGSSWAGAHLYNSSNQKAHASLNCSFQGCIWHKLSCFETHCLTLGLTVCKAIVQVWNFSRQIFSALRHTVSKPSNPALRTIYDQQTCQPSKNAMYLAPLQLV